MSSDPNKSMSGTLGEGTGLRDNLDKDMTNSDDCLEDVVEIKPRGEIKNRKLILIGGKTSLSKQIRCHRCATAKNQEDVGLFIQINSYIAWFHNKECFKLWTDMHGSKYETGANINQSTGEEIVEA